MNTIAALHAIIQICVGLLTIWFSIIKLYRLIRRRSKRKTHR